MPRAPPDSSLVTSASDPTAARVNVLLGTNAMEDRLVAAADTEGRNRLELNAATRATRDNIIVVTIARNFIELRGV